MEYSLEDYPGGKDSVASYLREKFPMDEDVFEFLMSYRWGQDNGCDVEKISAEY
jgi:hypothetical protein